MSLRTHICVGQDVGLGLHQPSRIFSTKYGSNRINRADFVQENTFFCNIIYQNIASNYMHYMRMQEPVDDNKRICSCIIIKQFYANQMMHFIS